MRTSFFTIITAACLPFLVHAEGRSEAIFNQLTRIPPAMLAEIRSPGSLLMPHVSSPAAARSLFSEGKDAYFRIPSNVYRSLKNDDGTDGVGVGFIPAQNVETVLTIESPPRFEMILQLAPGEAANVQSALQDLGYTIEENSGVSAYTNGIADFAVDIENRNPMDPFSGQLGSSARVVFQDDLIIGTRSWPYMLMLAKPSEPEWIWEPLAHAIDEANLGEAVLLQAQVLPSQIALTRGTPSGIPPWNFAMLADLSDGTTDTTMALFVYLTKTDADRAAARLKEGWSEPLSVDPGLVRPAPGQDFEEELRKLQENSPNLAELTEATPIVDVLGDGPFVTMLSLQTSPVIDNRQRPYNKGYQTIMNALYSAQLNLFGLPE